MGATARFTASNACEAFMEVQAQLLTVREFVDREILISWQRGHDTTRMRSLQKADAAIRVIDAQAKMAAGWASECADGIDAPAHGRAA